MGKRELGLILAFVVAGLIVWQVTAPKAEGPGFSFGNWMSDVRREMRGRNASAELKTTPAVPLEAGANELRVTIVGELTIKGEDRTDVSAEFTVTSNGFDDAEAKRLAEESKLVVSRFADSVVVTTKFPEEGSQQARLILRVPRTLRVQLDGRGTATVTDVAEVVFARASGTVKLTAVAGAVKGEFRGARLTLDGAQTLDLVSVNGEHSFSGIRGDVRLESRSGEVRLIKPGGRVIVTGRDGRIRIDGAQGDVRVEAVEGAVELNDIASGVEIDARAARVVATWQKAAQAKIQARDGSVELVLPKDAATYSLDARATQGELRVPESLTKTAEGQETSAIRSGGSNASPIFVRGVGTSITIR
ncbi:MAG: DUF4097 domain-containing protein [Acidobacteriota bacterium]|nr:DUF4097 domain-containing protein [Acidobacteriota bacterium]